MSCFPDFASHEMVYLMEAISSDEQQLKSNPKYVNKIVAQTLEPVTAIGGIRVLPDYSLRICRKIMPHSF